MTVKHQLSLQDHAFLERVELGLIAPADFNHKAHVRLAYIYLCKNDVERAYDRMRDSIWALLQRHGIDNSKYHETLTRAWMMAVHHFMTIAPEATSAEDFMLSNPRLLDTSIMLSHYSEGVLFSEESRLDFVKPDLEPIPQHA